jgi:HKD family nuclease
MSIAEPPVFYKWVHFLGNNLEIKFFNDNSMSFHPKAYFFEYEEGADLFIGSSNLSQSALKNGVEWNCRISKDEQC